MAEHESCSPIRDGEEIPCSSKGKSMKRSRENTVEEKRAMRKARKKRKLKNKVEKFKAERDNEKRLKENAVRNRVEYAGMSRTYWERWQWELQERCKLMVSQRLTSKSTPLVKVVLPYIDPSMLEDPLVNGEPKQCYVGRGSFGIVRLCIFRSIKVAVKEFLPHTLHEDVKKEARILSLLCHPYLPCFLGVCLTDTPLRIVMQFHGTNCKSTTLFQELRCRKLQSSDLVFGFCAQIVEAVHYLHSEVEILHNDISMNNILIKEDHIILIDFGKATKLSEARRYDLGETEKQEYLSKYPHLAPEVIYGQQRQTIYSDMYAVGLVFHHICDHSNISQLLKKSLKVLAERCRSLRFSSRPKSSDVLEYLKGVLI